MKRVSQKPHRDNIPRGSGASKSDIGATPLPSSPCYSKNFCPHIFFLYILYDYGR